MWSAKIRYKDDGLNQILKLNFLIISLEETHLYTHMVVDVGSGIPTILSSGLKAQKLNIIDNFRTVTMKP